MNNEKNINTTDDNKEQIVNPISHNSDQTINTTNSDSLNEVKTITIKAKPILKKPTPPIKTVNKKPILKTTNNKTQPTNPTENKKTQPTNPTENKKTQPTNPTENKNTQPKDSTENNNQTQTKNPTESKNTQPKDPNKNNQTQQQQVNTTNTQKKRKKKRKKKGKNQKESPWSTLHFHICLEYLEVPFAGLIYLQQWAVKGFKRPKRTSSRKRRRGRRRSDYFPPVYFHLCLKYPELPLISFIYLKKWNIFRNKDRHQRKEFITNEEQTILTLIKELSWRTAHMDEIETMLANLCEKFPKTFFKDPKKIKPLKIGIDRDLIKEFDLEHNFESSVKQHKRLMNEALILYTRSTEYLIKVCKKLYRIDLNGKRIERVTDSQAEKAEKLLKQLNFKPDETYSQKWLELWQFSLLLIILPQKYFVMFQFILLNFTPFTDSTITFKNWYKQ